jgi:ATP-dependent DNA helicase
VNSHAILFLLLQGNQLDFLLSKASEYSNFIAKDLDELQASMTDDAHRALQMTEKKRGKETNGSGNSKKKQRTGVNGAKELESVQAKDAMVRNAGTTRPIFLQPANLSPDCFLKDYQLEGVRWLASLFENGVSGILADGTSRHSPFFPSRCVR